MGFEVTWYYYINLEKNGLKALKITWTIKLYNLFL